MQGGGLWIVAEAGEGADCLVVRGDCVLSWADCVESHSADKCEVAAVARVAGRGVLVRCTISTVLPRMIFLGACWCDAVRQLC